VPLIAIAALAGLAIGLVIWAPWTSPPLLRPTGLTASGSTAASVAFRWSRPATGPAPDSYVILRAGTTIGSVPGTVTTYRQAGLAPATAYQYQVAAVRGGKRSAVSPVLVMRTAIPPLSAARLEGPWTVQLNLARRGGLMGARRWTESWKTRPECATGSCAEMLSGSIGGHPFTAKLDRTSALYKGTTRVRLFPCGSGASSFPMRDTMSFHIKVSGAHADNRVWTASSWTGALVMSNRYTSSGDLFCPASSQTAALTGSP
jgi:chitodextrinase